ncbi:hypothetical protein AMECASPLE_034500 [Ameca splendens]|uniref:Uncharacterized protein n=1 Tax=Ameca splendens TaxID=208324 RepID=A0ABV0ZS01_9TELE
MWQRKLKLNPQFSDCMTTPLPTQRTGQTPTTRATVVSQMGCLWLRWWGFVLELVDYRFEPCFRLSQSLCPLVLEQGQMDCLGQDTLPALLADVFTLSVCMNGWVDD